MDNRIPPIIKDYIKNKPNSNQVEFLSFNDWFISNDKDNDDWITVAKKDKQKKHQEYYTFSCLISTIDDSFSNFFSSSNWEIESSFGIPVKFEDYDDVETYDDETIKTINNITYTPFTFERHFNGYTLGYFQIIEHFLLYYNCFWVKDKCEYQSINDEGEIIVIAKHLNTNNCEQIIVDTHSLKNYLAINNVSLARFHDHRRQSTQEISDFLEEKATSYKILDTNCIYSLDLRIDIQYENIKSTSRLLGKDLIEKYPSPHIDEFSTEDEYLEFITGRGKDGKQQKDICNPDALTNNFSDKGTAHFLTPIYFKKEVLNKYYSEPKKYQVSEQSISYLDFWQISIDKTNENLIQVYLGDIGKHLPFKEQLHWKQYNIAPKGKISNHRFKRDFLVEFASPDIEEAPIMHFKEAFEYLQQKFIDDEGATLFKSLAEGDEHLYSTLHIPLTEEWKEFDEQILAIAKVTTDSLDNKVLKKLTGKKIGDLNSKGVEIKGLSGLLYEYLTITVKDDEITDSLIKPFNMIQALRSSSVAHRKSKELDKTLLKYDLEKFSNEDKFKKVVKETTLSLLAICKLKK